MADPITLPVWPATLPQAPIFPDGWQVSALGKTPDETESQYGQTNRRRVVSKRIMRCSLTFQMSDAQLAIFDAFYADDIYEGAARFSMPCYTPASMVNQVTKTVLMRSDVAVGSAGGPGRHSISFEVDVELDS